LFARLTRLYADWETLPCGVRVWLIRTAHALGAGISIWLTEYYLHQDPMDATILALVAIMGGQAALRQQIPRDRSGYPPRRIDPDAEEE